MIQRVIVIGGGASGLTAAVWAARQGAAVTILEHMDRVGKKILSTGNGKCNLTNRYLDKNCYRSFEPGFPYQVLSAFGVEETLDFFKGIGIYPKDKNGYIYPYSEQASSVLEVLRMECRLQKVEILCDCQISHLKKAGTGFCIDTSKGQFRADRVILAAGGKAAPITGSDGSGYELAKTLGHKVRKPLPALVQLRCNGNYFKQLAGIRTEAIVTLFSEGRKLSEEKGELQLTDYGISGIPVFQVSRFASKALDEGKEVTAVINFLPSMDCRKTAELLCERQRLMEHKTAEEFLVGLFQKKLATVLLSQSGISAADPVKTLNKKKIERLAGQISEFEMRVTATNPFANAQVCSGGIDTREIHADTMESHVIPGLYLAGEIIDVDGICGGYNLQWAWSSGAIAGINAGRGTYDTN